MEPISFQENISNETSWMFQQEPLTDETRPLIHTIAVFLLIIVSLLLHVTKSKETKSKDKENNNEIPKVPGLQPIIGNSIGKRENLYEKYEEWANKYGREKGCYECNLFGQRYVVFCSTEMILQGAKLRPFRATRIRRVMKALDSVGAKGLFSAEGGEWKESRRVVAPAMSHKNLRDYLPLMWLVTERLVEEWRKRCGVSGSAEGVAINRDMLRFALDVISLVGFGRDLDCLRRADSREAKDLSVLMKTITTRALSPIPYWEIPLVGQYLDGAGWAKRRIVKSFRSVVKDCKTSVRESKIDDNKHNQATRTTLLEKTVRLSEDGLDGWSDDRIIGNLVTFYAAGSETTNICLSLCLWRIAIDQTGLQDELYEEAKAMTNPDQASMAEIMDALPRLRSLAYEVFRFHAPIPHIGMDTIAEETIGGFKIPPKSTVILLTCYATRKGGEGVPLGPMKAPTDTFCSRRWLESSNGTGKIRVQKPSTSMGPSMASGTGFGSGLRMCPGRDFAELEIIVCLMSLLRSFEISLMKNHPPIHFVARATKTPNVDICLNLKCRD